MKIPLRLVDGILRVNVILLSKNYHFGAAHVTFVVDTGSDTTFISESDALRLQIPMKALEATQIFQMAGSKYSLLFGKECNFYFKTFENKTLRISVPNLPISRSTTKKTQVDPNIPSILGMDFLIRNGLSLYFNPQKDAMYLEKV